jgi:hypothetical protein
LGPLRKFQTKIAFYQRSQTELANAEETGCNHRVEDRVRNEIQAAPQHSKVIIGAMENNFSLFERHAQWLQIEISQRIDDEVAAALSVGGGWHTDLD